MHLKTFKFSDYVLPKGQKRLLKVAKLVETIHPSQFDMEQVMCKLGRDCGSSGCVIGWTAALKLFPEITYRRPYAYLNGESIADYGFNPELADFFGLNDAGDVDTLFGADYSTPLKKAAQIREYIQNQILNG